MRRPLIGLTPQWDMENRRVWIRPNYLEAVERAGAIPEVLPLTGDEDEIVEIARRMDGFLFTGGPDIRPSLYGQTLMPFCGTISDERDRLELPLFREAVLKRSKPCFGICRGIQVINVACGGTLFQDIPAERRSDIPHYQDAPYDLHCHAALLEPNSPFAQRLGTNEITVNSMHHQAIDRLGAGLVTTAVAKDGIVEAVCMPDKPFVLAVQWHPEYLPNEAQSHILFDAFAAACRAQY